jgi:hypothetical protein
MGLLGRSAENEGDSHAFLFESPLTSLTTGGLLGSSSLTKVFDLGQKSANNPCKKLRLGANSHQICDVWQTKRGNAYGN